jgi:hypothetical protein
LQKDDGMVSGIYPDGNFSRTTIMYCLWKSKGVTISPWSADVEYGAVEKDGKLYLAVTSTKQWKGKLVFDNPRHKQIMKMPLDYPRINQFPEWFTAELGAKYKMENIGSSKKYLSGKKLQQGVDVSLEPGQVRHFVISKTK